MILLKSKELLNHLEQIIHQDTQQHSTHFDLTVSNIYKYTSAGVLDFGGSEFKPAETKPVYLQKNEEDDYGWWHLPGGEYRVEMNEQIKHVEDTTALIVPHKHAQQAGVIANTYLMESPAEQSSIAINITIPEVGCNIKENARIAALYLLAR